MKLDPENSPNPATMFGAFRYALTAATRRWRFCVVWMLAQAGLALAATAPAYWFVRRANGDSVLLERLVNTGGIDTAWMIQAAHQPAAYDPFIRYSVLTALAVGLVMVVLNILLTGGTIGLFRPEADATGATFVAECRTHFLRLLGVAGLSWIGYAAAAIVGISVLSYAGRVDETAISPDPANRLRLGAAIGTVVAFGAINCFFDYVKIGTVHDAATGIFTHVVNAARFFFRAGLGAVGLFLLSAAVWALVTIGGSYLVLSVGRDGYALIGVGFLVQQVVMLVRAWVRFVFYAGEYRYFVGAKTA